MKRQYPLPAFVVEDSEDESNILLAHGFYEWASRILIQAPEALDGTLNVEASLDGENFATIQTPEGVAVALVAGQITILPYLGWVAMRISGTTQTAERTILAYAAEEV